MPGPPRCASCRFLEYRTCRRHAPRSDWGDGQQALLAWLFKLYWKGDAEIDSENIREVESKYIDVGFQAYARWPHIESPDEDWCGDWTARS
jgi:hypothetical protein